MGVERASEQKCSDRPKFSKEYKVRVESRAHSHIALQIEYLNGAICLIPQSGKTNREVCCDAESVFGFILSLNFKFDKFCGAQSVRSNLVPTAIRQHIAQRSHSHTRFYHQFIINLIASRSTRKKNSTKFARRQLFKYQITKFTG